MTLNNRPRREPAINAPGIILAVIALILAIHALRGFLAAEVDLQVIVDYAFIPLRLYLALWPDGLADLGQSVARDGAVEAGIDRMEFARLLLAEGNSRPWTLLTYAGLHGSWGHVIVNSAWLLAFGTPVGRRLGTGPTLILLVASALAGALLHFAVHPLGVQPVIGASAAASGVMGAATRFAFGSLALGAPANDTRLLTLAEVFRNPRASVFIAIWFGVNLVFGVFATDLGLAPGGIAWEAHIGGFLAGLFLIPLLERRPRH